MRRSTCSDPIPPGTPGGITFFGCPGLLIATFLPCPALYKHSKHSFFQCPALFITHLVPLTTGLPRRGGMWAEQFDWRMNKGQTWIYVNRNVLIAIHIGG